MDSGKSAAGKQSKPSHFDAAARGATAKHRFITPEPGTSLDQNEGRLFKSVSPTITESTILNLAQAVAKASQANSSHG